MILWSITIFGALLLLAHWISALMVMRRLRRAPEVAEPAAGWPRITLLRPVCGLDPQDRQTFASSFAQNYPDWELIFCVAHPDDPAIPVLRELIAAHPHVPAQLLIGETRLNGNPKLNNLLKGWDAATGSFVAMSDCNVLLPSDYLRQLVGRWRPDTGLVSAPPLATQASGLWAAVEAAFLNGNQARLQLAADCLGAGFAQGKTLMWRKADLDAAGGLPALARDLAEDVACTKVAHAMGRKVHLTTRPFPQPIGRRSAGAVWARQLRWSKVRRAGFPGLFLLEPLNGPLIPFAALALPVLSGAVPQAALIALPLLWYLPEWAMARAGGWRFGGIDLFAAMIRDALLPALWVSSLGRQGFDWRGTAMSAPEPRNDAMPTV